MKVTIHSRLLIGVFSSYAILSVGIIEVVEANEITTAALFGQATPNLGPGITLNNVFGASINDAGEVSFIGQLSGSGIGPDNTQAMMVSNPSSGVHLVAQEGDQVPGAAAGVELDFTFVETAAGGGSSLAFVNRLRGPGAGLFTRDAMLTGDTGNGFSVLARAGDPAPGFQSGVNHFAFGDPAMNEAREIAFVGGVAGPGISLNNSTAIFSSGGGSGLRLVAKSFDPAPVPGGGANYFILGGQQLEPSFLNDAAIDGAGNAAFASTLQGPNISGTNNSAIFREETGLGVQLVVQSGELAPGVGAGGTYAGFLPPALSEDGSLAFISGITGSGQTSLAVFRESSLGGYRICCQSR